MRSRRAFLALAIGFGALSMIATGLLLAAVEFTGFQTATVRNGQTVRGDFASTSARVEILGNVQGDATVRAGYMRQVGSVGGDLEIAAGRAEVRGPVDGSVRVYAASVSFYGEIRGDVEVYGGQVMLVEGAVIHGDFTVHGGSVTLVARSQVEGDLRGEAARLTIEGSVGGGVDVSAWRLTLSPGARVGSDLRYWSPHWAAISSDASVGGEVERVAASDRLPMGSILLWHGAALPRAFLLMAIGAVLSLLAPHALRQTADGIRRDAGTLVLSGLAVAALVPLALITLALFIVTLPVVAVLAAIYLLVAYLSMVIVGTGIGRAILYRRGRDSTSNNLFASMLLGITILAVLRTIPIRFADVGIAAATAVVGFGATARWITDGRVPKRTGSERRLRGFLLGAAAGAVVVTLAVAAVFGASTGTLAAAATLSRSAVFTWEVGPRRLAASALLLAAISFILAGLVIAVARGGRANR